MSTIDLKDAYYLISIDKSHLQSYRKYLRCIFEEEIYEFTCLPFGLKSAPYGFTKLLKPLTSFLRILGLLSIVYLDDRLLLDRNQGECLLNFIKTQMVLENLGFVIKLSDKMPQQKC